MGCPATPRCCSWKLGLLGPPAVRLRELERLGTAVGENFLRNYALFFDQVEQLPTDEPWYFWASPSPHERMGLYFAAAHYGAKVPRFLVCDSTKLLDAASAKAVAALMQAAEVLSTAAYADQWDRWLREKSVLRVGDAFAIAARVYVAYAARQHGVFTIEFLLWRVQELQAEQAI